MQVISNKVALRCIGMRHLQITLSVGARRDLAVEKFFGRVRR